MKKVEMIIVESGCIRRVTELLLKNKINGKILYVSDEVVDGLYGDIVKEQIQQVGQLKEEYVDYNSIRYAMNIAERIIATDIKCIVGLGGGKVLDVCKYASYIARIPFLSIPTTAANDGLASPVAVLKREDNKPKSLGCSMATMMLVDIDIIASCPSSLIKAGIGDTISNLTALMDWQLACQRNQDSMNGYAYLMSRCALDSLMSSRYELRDTEFIKTMVNSLILSGVAMDFVGTSRPVSGSEHLFSHALDYYSKKPNLHGIQTGLGTLSVLKLLGKETEDVLNYLHRYEVDVNPLHLGIDKELFIYCFMHAQEMRPNRYTCLNEIELTTKKLEQVYQWLCAYC